jgi:hypothetical protein
MISPIDRISATFLSWIGLGLATLILALCVLFAGPVHARDPDGRYADSPFKEWFKSQHNEQGAWCCDESDGHLFDGDYTINSDGSVNTEVEGHKVWIPHAKVLKGPNPTGSAVVWYRAYDAGEPSVYCFSPGAGG